MRKTDAPSTDSRPGSSALVLKVPSETADILRVGRRTLRALVAAGQIAVIRVSTRRLAFDVRDLEAFIAARRVAPRD